MAKAKQGLENGEPVIIKKYANRRLYDTQTSAYITLENLAEMVRNGRDFKVLDAKSGDDITHGVLTQIIVESEGKGQAMLPSGFLRQIISMYGDSMQSMVPQYLEASMDAFRRNQTQFRSALAGALTGGPFAELTKRNLEMFEAATSVFTPKTGESDESEAAPVKDETDVAALKAEMDALRARLDKLSH